MNKFVVISVALLVIQSAFSAVIDPPHCVSWRQTRDCDGQGRRLPSEDKSCSSTITNGQSGFCECENRRRVREVGCDHHSFTCEQSCREHSSADLSIPQGYEYVTCGSTIKLVHEMSRFRLHSHEINYGTGSGQQSITAHGSRNDPNSYWMVKESDGHPPCKIGEKIQCGDHVRLEHVATRKNLHTHNIPSPLSKNLEVSGFGVAGEGDEGDNWILVCEEMEQCDSESKSCADEQQRPAWKRETLIRLQSAATAAYLQTDSQTKFDNSNCPNCPINGQLEVAASKSSSDISFWFASEGVYVSST